MTLAAPGSANAASDVVTTCLRICHSGLAGVPNVATVYLGDGENAGHKLNHSPKVVSDSSSATHPRGSRMPCTECHVVHGAATSSIFMFSESRTGGPITQIRDLCEGCHRPFDSAAPAPIVCGMPLKELPDGVTDHGSASSRPCSDCHGSTGHDPQGHGGSADCIDCHGTTGSHAIHVSATDERGPRTEDCRECRACHDTEAYPFFAAGTDSDSSGHIELDETTVCDTCHSPGGDYNGVDSTGQSVGAKDNWASRVYATANSLQAGKQKWCAGCHDDDPALIRSIPAPPVIGNEDAAYIYGTGYGFYKTGHGVPASSKIPSNGFKPGAELECDACHDLMLTHVDGKDRSFSSTGTPSTYRSGYRLALVGSANPMEIPWTGLAANATTQYRLCTKSGCHDTSPSPFTTAAAHTTNFWNDARGDVGYNMHSYHLGFTNNLRWSPDWGTSMTSRITCVTCHNVHGSQYLAMIRDGELESDEVQRRPGLKMWYWNSTVSAWAESNPDPPEPENLTLAMSEGWVWRGATSSNLCTHCHGNNNTLDVPRALWQPLPVAPVLAWTGAAGYEDDGVNPDSGSAADSFAFRIVYTDANNEAPSYVRMRIDRNDDGDYADAGESVSMDPDSPGDTTYYNGNPYQITLQLAKAGDNTLAYYFETTDGNTPVVMTPVRSVTVTNAPPQLEWTGETGYVDDGVNPNSGTTGITTFEFRVSYRDADGEAPSGGAPWLQLDLNDDGDFLDAGETISMSPMAGGDYISGKRYTYSTTIARQSDDTIGYRFGASDGTDTAQTATKTVTVLENVNFAPVLAWTGESGYTADGVDPENQAGGKPFYFRIDYSDLNGEAPGVAQVWVDLDDDTVYEPGEKFTMDDLVTTGDPLKRDGDYFNGEIFAKKVYVPFAGDGTLKYCFYFTDSSAAEATGVQLTDRNLSVFNALDVPAEYGTIQLAVNASTTGATVLVADGTYADFDFNGKDITVESVNGPASTTISGPAGGYVVDFNSYGGGGSDSTLRGFTVRGGARGIQSNMSNVTVQDCVVEGNTAYGIYHQSGSADPLVVEDCTIRNNTGPGVSNANNTAIITLRDTAITGNSGGGISSGGAGSYTIERCTVSSNTTAGNGAGFNTSSGVITMVVRDSTFDENVASTHGGAMYFNGAASTNVTVERTRFRGNSSTGGTSVGGAIYMGQGTYALTNLTLSGNYTATNGGGAYINNGGATFTNCSFGGNSANSGGAIWYNLTASGQSKIHNCVLWGDESRGTAYEEIDAFNDTARPRMEVQYTDIDQSYTIYYNQTGNMSEDPPYEDRRPAASAPTPSGDYHLKVSTENKVEGKASATYAPADDIDKEVRPQGTGPDMGSDELPEIMAMNELVTIYSVQPDAPVVVGTSGAIKDGRVSSRRAGGRTMGGTAGLLVSLGLGTAALGSAPTVGRFLLALLRRG